MTVENVDLERLLIGRIEELVEKHPANREGDGRRYFDAPLVGFASADDELFTRYKSIIGPFHWTPGEVLNMVPGSGTSRARTVVSWILPVAGEARDSNRKEDRYPSREWGRTRNFGELFNDVLRRAVVQMILEVGGQAAAPMLLAEWKRIDDPESGLASTWSERHAAFACGLGTFSLSDGFITPLGIAHRTGSVVMDRYVKPSARPYLDHRQNCLTCSGKDCGVCIDRCPVGAVTRKGHDKNRCREYTHGPEFKKVAREYDVEETGCGLCQTGVPCEDRIPNSKFQISD